MAEVTTHPVSPSRPLPLSCPHNLPLGKIKSSWSRSSLQFMSFVKDPVLTFLRNLHASIPSTPILPIRLARVNVCVEPQGAFWKDVSGRPQVQHLHRALPAGQVVTTDKLMVPGLSADPTGIRGTEQQGGTAPALITQILGQGFHRGPQSSGSATHPKASIWEPNSSAARTFTASHLGSLSGSRPHVGHCH